MKWFCAIALVATAACSPTEVCHHGIWLEASPKDTILAVGEAFEPEVRMERCPDPRVVEAVLSTEDVGVVEIVNGSITAIGVGDAEVTATVEGLEDVMAVIAVTVVD